MNDRSLACFAAAERTGSFSAAAWELSTTQQNVSYNIRKLEDELGFPLFVRRASHVELTAGGADFLRWYRGFDGAIRQAAQTGPAGIQVGSVTDVQVRCFLAAAKRGSMGEAAEAMFYTLQAFSGIIAGLEKALGTRLFVRERGQLVLTAPGAAYRDAFEKGAKSFSEMARLAKSRYERARDRAVAGVSEWISPKALLGQAMRAFPHEVEIRSLPNQALLEALEAGEVDVAFWSEGHTPVNRGMDITELAEEDLCLFAPAKDGGCPVLVCPGWPRSFIENRVISTQETAFRDFTSTGTILVETLDELISMVSAGGYAAVGDRRFGVLRDIPGLRAVPLEMNTHIVACRRTNAGDDCGARLTGFLKNVL